MKNIQKWFFILGDYYQSTVSLRQDWAKQSNMPRHLNLLLYFVVRIFLMSFALLEPSDEFRKSRREKKWDARNKNVIVRYEIHSRASLFPLILSFAWYLNSFRAEARVASRLERWVPFSFFFFRWMYDIVLPSFAVSIAKLRQYKQQIVRMFSLLF